MGHLNLLILEWSELSIFTYRNNKAKGVSLRPLPFELKNIII